MLASEGDPEIAANNVVTLKEFLKNQREMELQAAAAMPFRFDRCSAELGPLRQNLHICPESESCAVSPNKHPLAFCYACAISCHNFQGGRGSCEESSDSENVWDAYGDDQGHAIEEIWSRRNFMCDCPSTGQCKLLPAPPSRFENHKNSYHSAHNFAGRYCLCQKRGWAAGDQTMYQCEVCEDWFHDTCVARDFCMNSNSNALDTQSLHQIIPDEESFNDFICRGCVKTFYSSFFQFLKLNSFIFSFSSDSEGPLFLVDGWRQNIHQQMAITHVPNQCPVQLEHLLREAEPVYEPEIDSEATESIYDRKIQNLKKLFINSFL